MTKIFISYRRDDTKLIVGRIFDRLKEKFGRDGVFMDIDKIPFGVNFREHLDREVSQADAVLVLIGHGWLNARDEQGRRCLDNPDDFVRIEIESALKRNIRVGAVLIDGVPLPHPDQLPESLHPLLKRHAAQIDVVRDFDAHMARLVADLAAGRIKSLRMRRIWHSFTEILGTITGAASLFLSGGLIISNTLGTIGPVIGIPIALLLAVLGGYAGYRLVRRARERKTPA